MCLLILFRLRRCQNVDMFLYNLHTKRQLYLFFFNHITWLAIINTTITYQFSTPIASSLYTFILLISQHHTIAIQFLQSFCNERKSKRYHHILPFDLPTFPILTLHVYVHTIVYLFVIFICLFFYQEDNVVR